MTRTDQPLSIPQGGTNFLDPSSVLRNSVPDEIQSKHKRNFLRRRIANSDLLSRRRRTQKERRPVNRSRG